MKIVDIVKLGKEMLKTMSDYGVKDGDWKYIDLYEEYKEMRKKGFKYRYVIMQLSLTHKEAERIVSGMIPKAPWSFEAWKNAMVSYGIETEEMPCYNKYALWAEMNKQYSDHAETIARDVLGKSLSEIPAQKMVEIIYAFALDVLKDKDEVYSIREYFGL